MLVFLEELQYLLKVAAAYYVVQLGRSVLLSVFVLAFIMGLRVLLRKTTIRKGLLWTLLVPVLFVGKLKLFYDNKYFVWTLFWWNNFCFEQSWFCYLYIGVAIVLGVVIFRKRRRMHSYVKSLEQREIEGVPVYVSDLEITPFAAGVLRPKIIIPEKILETFEAQELQTILLHEKLHIRLGHLVCCLFWDILQVFLWMNPLLPLCAKHFKADLEDICDKVTIHRSGDDFYSYGKLLVKCMRILNEEEKQLARAAAFADSSDYESVKRRIIRVAEYKPYKRTMAWCLGLIVSVGILGMLAGIYENSYKRCNDMNIVCIYSITDDEIIVTADQAEIGAAVTYDDTCVYVDTAALNEHVPLEEYRDKELYIFFGGFFKIPGIGGGGDGVIVSGMDLVEENYTVAYEKPKDNLWIVLLKLL